mgnify:CR=1 FL=1
MFFLKRFYQVSGTCTTALLLMIVFVPIGTSQIASAQETGPVPSEAIEEVAADGENSLQVLRRNLDDAESRFFDLFNSFNRDSTYDVSCEDIVKLGSRRKAQECKPAFQWDYEAALALINTESFTGVAERPRPNRARFEKQQEKYQKKLGKTVSDHPEMRQALNEFANAKNVYEAERQRR